MEQEVKTGLSKQESAKEYFNQALKAFLIAAIAWLINYRDHGGFNPLLIFVNLIFYASVAAGIIYLAVAIMRWDAKQ